MPPLREPSVLLGVEFLSHPNVVSHSREDKTSFLRGKGLTGEEIDEAFKRVNGEQQPQQPASSAVPATGGVSAPQYAPQPRYLPSPPPPAREEDSLASWLFSTIVPTSLAISSGASLLYFYKNYVEGGGNEAMAPLQPRSQALLQPPPLMPEQQQQQQQQPSMLQANATLAQPQPQQQQTAPPMPAWMQPSPVASPAPTASDFEFSADQHRSAPASSNADTALLRETLDALKETVDLLKQQQQKTSASSDLQASLPLILQAMQSSGEVKAELSAIKSLLLATIMQSGANNGSNGNSNAANLELAQALLAPTTTAPSPKTTESVDPTSAQSQPEEPAQPVVTEEESAEARKDKQAEEYLVLSRAALADMVALCAKLDPEVARGGYGMLIMFFKNLLKDAMNPRYRRIAKGNANYTKLLQPLEGHGKFLEQVGFEERGGSFELGSVWTQNLQEEADGYARRVLADAVAGLEAVRDKAAKAAPASPAASAAPASDTPAYPLSFEEIIRLQKEGKRPEGIKDIPNDRLSEDAPSPATLQPVAKPWELSAPGSSKIQIQQVTEEEDEE